MTGRICQPLIVKTQRSASAMMMPVVPRMSGRLTSTLISCCSTSGGNASAMVAPGVGLTAKASIIISQITTLLYGQQRW
jgi:hypothetical protein